MQQTKSPLKFLSSSEEEEEDIVYRKRIRRISCSSSPEPNEQEKKRILKPDKTDKAGRSKIFHVISQGNIAKVKELVENGANVNFKDNAGWTPLHEAALKGQYEIGKYLIECGADVNARGFGQDTPLHDASSNAQVDCIRLLLEQGADVFALNEYKQRPIDVCEDQECRIVLTAKMKHLDRLIARDREGKTLLHCACIENDLQKTRHLLEQGADVNAKDNREWTPLHWTCFNGNLALVKLLIHQGAAVNISGSEDMDTPLHKASKQGHMDIVLYLIRNSGVDVMMKDKHDQNAYDVSTPYPSIRQILTARMDEVRLEKEACNALDDIARKTAAKNESERQLTREQRKIQHVMRLFANLEEKPCEEKTMPVKRKRRIRSISTESSEKKKPQDLSSLDPHKKDPSGKTHLHTYSARGKQEMVQILLDMGADPNQKDHAGWTPLHESALRGKLQIVRLLLEYGADVSSKGGPDSDTPLHDATENNHCEVIELLLKHGADPLAKNEKDINALDIAIENSNEDIIRLLRNALPPKKLGEIKDLKIKDGEKSVIHSPISTPPPEPLFKHDMLHFVQLPDNETYLIDFQVCLFLGMDSTTQLWKKYPNIFKKVISREQKSRLYCLLKPLIIREELDVFLSQDHYFVHSKPILNIIKHEYESQKLVKVSLDLEEKKLPPKLVWKSNYHIQ